jgi:ABC-2 type transport system permease protein
LGLAFAGYGVFSSSLTSNQIVAWMIGMIPLMVFVWFSSFVVSHVEGVLRDLFQRVNVNRHLDQFNRGLILFESVVFFLATAAVFLFATVKVVESKRWR